MVYFLYRGPHGSAFNLPVLMDLDPDSKFFHKKVPVPVRILIMFIVLVLKIKCTMILLLWSLNPGPQADPCRILNRINILRWIWFRINEYGSE
jgi:hypothetical protein